MVEAWGSPCNRQCRWHGPTRSRRQHSARPRYVNGSRSSVERHRTVLETGAEPYLPIFPDSGLPPIHDSEAEGAMRGNFQP